MTREELLEWAAIEAAKANGVAALNSFHGNE
ncbi:Uncharacterised protein [Plesiomonas shigelloides]|nr:Uncharacterised protein [Plesiomonas shigelloides]